MLDGNGLVTIIWLIVSCTVVGACIGSTIGAILGYALGRRYSIIQISPGDSMDALVKMVEEEKDESKSPL